MTSEKLRELIMTTFSAVTFIYNGKNCGIDPYSTEEYDIWYGENDTTVKSFDEVLNIPLFDGKALCDIIDNIADWD